MKFLVRFAPFLATALLLLTSCGNGSGNPNSVSGNWSATLANTSGQNVFAFTITLNQAGDNSVSGSNLKFTSGAPCFQSISSETGQFTLNGTFKGVTTNTLELKIVGAQPGEPSLNTLTMEGSVSSNSISGTWVLQGVAAGCTGEGNFTMTRS